MARSRSRRILLVNPRQTLRHYSIQFGLARLAGRRSIMPSLSLGLLAAHTPPDWDVRIADEETGPLPYDDQWDVVGITTLSNTADRAYQIADRFRSLGVRVVLGGPHATFCSDEAAGHADAIVRGEAELVWPQLLADLDKGALRPLYHADIPLPAELVRAPRWESVDPSHYVSFPVQATRGCPYACEFCLVTRMFGRKVRTRPVEAILAEVASLPLKRIFFVDDNLTINRPFARRLIAGLAPLGVSWNCHASLDIADDPDLIRSMADAGCAQVLLGFESLNPESIAETGKYQNLLERYERAVDRLHSAGIFVIGSFIVGFDHDTTAEFDRIRQFSDRTGLSFVAINLLGASPGTALHERLQTEKRLCRTPAEWRGGMMPVLRYAHMSQEELFSAFVSTLTRFFSSRAVWTRTRILLEHGRFLRAHPAQDVTWRQKVIVTLRLIGHYLLTFDTWRWRLFAWVLGHIVRKQIAAERAVFLLLSIMGYRSNIRWFLSQRRKLLAHIRSLDPGPAHSSY